MRRARNTKSSRVESSDDDEQEDTHEEEQDEEAGNDEGGGGKIKEEEEEPLAQRAPRSTHLEVAHMATAPKGTPSKPKAPQEEHPKSSRAQDPEEMSEKKNEKGHGKSLPKKKSKGKGKKKVDDKPNHVHYALEGEPHGKMPAGATRCEKYHAYNNDV